MAFSYTIATIVLIGCLCISGFCVFISLKCLEKAQKENNFTAFTAAILVFVIAILSMVAGVVSLVVIPLKI